MLASIFILVRLKFSLFVWNYFWYTKIKLPQLTCAYSWEQKRVEMRRDEERLTSEYTNIRYVVLICWYRCGFTHDCPTDFIRNETGYVVVNDVFRHFIRSTNEICHYFIVNKGYFLSITIWVP